MLLEIRKSEFGEYARGCLFVDLIERAVWQYYLDRFLYRFPECDERAAKCGPQNVSDPGKWAREPDPLWREQRWGPVTIYAGDELEALPPAQPHLARSTGTESDPILINYAHGNRRPPADYRSRLSEPPLSDEPEAIVFEGPEFDFTEAA